MNTLRKIWHTYRAVAVGIGTLLLVSIAGQKAYKSIFDPDNVPADAAFIEQQLGIPCAGLTLNRASWDKQALCLSADVSPSEAWIAGLAAAGWVEQQGLPGLRRVFERSGFTLALTEPGALLVYPTWLAANNNSLTTANDVRKAARH